VENFLRNNKSKKSSQDKNKKSIITPTKDERQYFSNPLFNLNQNPTLSDLEDFSMNTVNLHNSSNFAIFQQLNKIPPIKIFSKQSSLFNPYQDSNLLGKRSMLNSSLPFNPINNQHLSDLKKIRTNVNLPSLPKLFPLNTKKYSFESDLQQSNSISQDPIRNQKKIFSCNSSSTDSGESVKTYHAESIEGKNTSRKNLISKFQPLKSRDPLQQLLTEISEIADNLPKGVKGQTELISLIQKYQ
jgi:hypothetical protein